MNKKQLIKQTSEKLKLTQKECLDCLNVITQIIQTSLNKGEEVSVGILGKFTIKSYKERVSYNPVLKTKILLQAKKLPVFKCSKTFKESIR